jgi:putative transcriptional regulator
MIAPVIVILRVLSHFWCGVSKGIMASTKKNSELFTLGGKLLLAMPSIGDPRFHKAVILICAHDENGAMGLIINHSLPDMKFPELLDQLGISSDIKINPAALTLPVMSGGPVESARGFLLHSSEFQQAGTVQVDEDFSITGTIEALRDFANGNGPEQALFILGYAGWGQGQIEQELQQNAWLVVDPDLSIIFHQKADEKWDMAMNKLGFDPAMLSGQSGRA